MQRVRNVNELLAWIASAAPGARILYYEGWLSRNRGRSPELNELADAVFLLSGGKRITLHKENPKVIPGANVLRLLQRRCGVHSWEYIAELARPVTADEMLAAMRPVRR